MSHDDEDESPGFGSTLQLAKVSRGLEALLHAVGTSAKDQQTTAKEFEGTKRDVIGIQRDVQRLADLVVDCGERSLVTQMTNFTYRLKALEDARNEEKREGRAQTISWAQLITGAVLVAMLNLIVMRFEACDQRMPMQGGKP